MSDKTTDIEPFIDIHTDRSPSDPHKYVPTPRVKHHKIPKLKQYRPPKFYQSVIDGKVKTA